MDVENAGICQNNTIKKEAYEYMWNMSFILSQGLGHLIPNDNLAEINVHLMKELKKELKHSQADRRNRISIIAKKKLFHVNAFQFLPGREHRSLVNFSCDISENLNTVELNK